MVPANNSKENTLKSLNYLIFNYFANFTESKFTNWVFTGNKGDYPTRLARHNSLPHDIYDIAG